MKKLSLCVFLILMFGISASIASNYQATCRKGDAFLYLFDNEIDIVTFNFFENMGKIKVSNPNKTIIKFNAYISENKTFLTWHSGFSTKGIKQGLIFKHTLSFEDKQILIDAAELSVSDTEYFINNAKKFINKEISDAEIDGIKKSLLIKTQKERPDKSFEFSFTNCSGDLFSIK